MDVLWITTSIRGRRDLNGAPDPGMKLFVLGPCADEEDSAAWCFGHAGIVIRPHQWTEATMSARWSRGHPGAAERVSQPQR